MTLKGKKDRTETGAGGVVDEGEAKVRKRAIFGAMSSRRQKHILGRGYDR